MSKDNILEKADWFQKKCRHNKFQVDSELEFVSCGICGERLNALWVLDQLCSSESRQRLELARLEKLVEITREKTKCKCEKCGEMTSIANRKECAKAQYG